MSRRKSIFIIITFCVLLISIGISIVFIPKKKEEQFSDQINFWKSTQNTFSEGSIEVNNIFIKWEKYKYQNQVKMDANINYDDEETRLIYYRAQDRQWLHIPAQDKYIRLPEFSSTMESFSMYDILLFLWSNVNYEKIGEPNDKDSGYQWNLTKDQMIAMINNEIINKIDIESDNMISLYVKSYHVQKKIAANNINLDYYKNKYFSKEFLENMLLSGDVKVKNKQNQITTELNLYISNKLFLQSKEVTCIFDQPIEIPSVENDKLIPIDEFILFR